MANYREFWHSVCSGSRKYNAMSLRLYPVLV